MNKKQALDKAIVKASFRQDLNRELLKKRLSKKSKIEIEQKIKKLDEEINKLLEFK